MSGSSAGNRAAEGARHVSRRAAVVGGAGALLAASRAPARIAAQEGAPVGVGAPFSPTEQLALGEVVQNLLREQRVPGGVVGLWVAASA